MDVDGASALVTGATSGLGEATVRQLAERGARCVIVGRNATRGEAIADEIGGRFVKADVRNTDQLITAVEAARDLGPVRVAVAAAGVGWATRLIGRDGS